MIGEILPDGVVTVEAFGDELADAALFPEEERVIRHAVDKRREEFTAARACARRALAKLGVPPVPILPGERGSPGWPPGMVGCITHCAGYRAAAVARAADVITLGIDAEPHSPLPDGVVEHVARPEDVVHLRELRRTAPEVHWDRLLFSAKESIYKAWFPLARRWLDFQDAVLTATAAGTFTARLLVPAPPQLTLPLHGRWLVRDGLVVTTCALPAPSRTLPGRPTATNRTPRMRT